ncbi:MAG: PhzF family phenazine biosynthesis isomerase [Ignavibacteria bacterium]|nr:PhzF family phenazine biosynthesis isomerase [Ignavibacteria bacterium]
MTPVELVRPKSSPRDRSTITIYQVDAFTTIPLTGNPAGVVVDADGLTTEQMQQIAREMFVSETAFILPSTRSGADLQIRWFTPQTEVPLCGHATIAGFHVLAQEALWNMKADGRYRFQVETKSGILPVDVQKGAASIEVFLGLHPPAFTRAGQYKLDAMRILNINLDQIENRMPLVMTDYLYVPIRRLHTLYSMKPNFSAMNQFLSNRNLTGLCVFTTETVDRTSHLHSRFFAPPVGIDEDPVTGSANGPLGAYLVEYGKIKLDGETMTFVGEQGDVIGRGGRVTIEVTHRNKKVRGVRIGGTAVTVLKGSMVLR